MSRRAATALVAAVALGVSGCGGGDRALAAALRVRVRLSPGGHDAAYWHAHYPDYLRFYASALARC